jgi:hypothetical protein
MRTQHSGGGFHTRSQKQGKDGQLPVSTEGKTIVATARGNHAAAHIEIMSYLQWDEYTLYEQIFNSGLMFLRHHFGNDEDGEYFQYFSKSKSFWNWYKSEWYHTDRSFLKKHGKDVQMNGETAKPYPPHFLPALYLEYTRHACVLSKKISDDFYNWVVIQEKHTKIATKNA